MSLLALGFAFCLLGGRAEGTDWVRPRLTTNQPIWGIRGGLLWAIPPGGFPAPGGPRGLIRLGYPNATNGAYALINFIAVEPIVRGKKGFSELEGSKLDGMPGKRFWAHSGTATGAPMAATNLAPGELTHPSPGVEQLDVAIGVEPFANGAHVRLIVSQRSDAPDEIQLTIHSDADSEPMEYCILTATMGNLARTRLLWLRQETVSSLRLYSAYKGGGFAPHASYALAKLTRTSQGDALVAVTTDETDPSLVFPFAGSRSWHYGGFKVTQYWKQSRQAIRDDLHAAVNARYTYWQSRQPIPGGVAFENFELRERFYEGQSFVFGITPKTPAQLGFGGP